MLCWTARWSVHDSYVALHLLSLQTLHVRYTAIGMHDCLTLLAMNMRAGVLMLTGMGISLEVVKPTVCSMCHTCT